MAMVDLADLLRRHPGDAGVQAAGDASARTGEKSCRADQDALYPLLAAIFGADPDGFGALVARLFAHGDTGQRAAILGQLLAACGQEPHPGAPGYRGSGERVSPVEDADAPASASDRFGEFTKCQVEVIANRARARSPAVVEAMSRYCAHHPRLLAALGGPTAAVAMTRLADPGDQGKTD